jgi:hypothetical protein
MSAPFVLNDLEVIQFRASKSGTQPEHVDWRVGYAPETIPASQGTARVVVATLHAGGEKGWADLTVGSVFAQGPPSESQDAIADEIAESDAIQALFMFARSHLVGMLATIGVTVDIDRSIPDEFEVEPLALLEEDDEDGEGIFEPDPEHGVG